MVAHVFLREVKRPVGVEVAGGTHGAESEHGLGAGEGPASPRPIHSVLHEVAARALDDACGDREPVAKGLLVVHEACARAIGEVVARDVDRLGGLLTRLLLTGCPPTDRARYVTSAAPAQEGEQAVAHPAFGLLVALSKQGASGVPDVFQDMHEVDQDGHLDARAPGLSLDGSQLPGLAVHEHDPSSRSGGVAPPGLVEGFTDDRSARLFHARPDALVRWAGALG